MKKEKVLARYLEKGKNKERGITLVALVITIIILIILATVTINFAFGNNGLIQRAEDARDYYANDTSYTDESITNVESYLDEIINGVGSGNGGEDEMPEIPISEAKGQDEGFSEKTIVVDNQNNKIVVPEGFKIADDSGDTVQ